MMENMLFVLLSVMALGALAWYARQRALRRTGLVWLCGAVLGFLVAGPLGVFVWVGISLAMKLVQPQTGSAGTDSRATAADDNNIVDVHEDLRIAKKWQRNSQVNAKF